MTQLVEFLPPPPLFFLSYARSGRGTANVPAHELNRQVLTFFSDLSENLSGLVARRAGDDPGFMDRAISATSRWSPELLQALGTCQAFVPLLSGPYTTSGWCAKEWHAFSRRKVTGPASSNLTGIFPVIRAPYPEARTPAAIRTVQRFSPDGLPNVDILAEYEEYGVSGLMWMRRDIAYRGVVWRLAQSIAEFGHSHYVEPHILRRAELRNIFRERAS